MDVHPHLDPADDAEHPETAGTECVEAVPPVVFDEAPGDCFTASGPVVVDEAPRILDCLETGEDAAIAVGVGVEMFGHFSVPRPGASIEERPRGRSEMDEVEEDVADRFLLDSIGPGNRVDRRHSVGGGARAEVHAQVPLHGT